MWIILGQSFTRGLTDEPATLENLPTRRCDWMTSLGSPTRRNRSSSKIEANTNYRVGHESRVSKIAENSRTDVVSADGKYFTWDPSPKAGGVVQILRNRTRYLAMKTDKIDYVACTTHDFGQRTRISKCLPVALHIRYRCFQRCD